MDPITMRHSPAVRSPAPLPPFRLLFQEPRDPPPGLCAMMNARTFARLDDARRHARAMMNDRARKPVQILDANRRIVWDEYGDDHGR
ncbi:hypothetical protein NVS89_07215 [Ancylobacter sp. MQZ15Z-1]|uniref:Uncharacterized protein n=1 Tax=Ancylobacter mangrovi TaxID=2972472 RepID=A0A9X2PEV6_9HYPH|nr:hypothetical protein [Ancylobacter mangrovi]MCS0494883.1 hypothetical protein [Ancylobacter mangrovi]